MCPWVSKKLFGFSSSIMRKSQGQLSCPLPFSFSPAGSAIARDLSCLQLSNFGSLFTINSLATSRRKDDCTALGSVVTLHSLDISREGGKDSGLSPVETVPGTQGSVESFCGVHSRLFSLHFLQSSSFLWFSMRLKYPCLPTWTYCCLVLS